MLHAVKVDIEVYSGTVRQNYNELQLLHSELRSITHQAEQARERTMQKESVLIRTHFNLHKINKAIDALKEANKKVRAREATLKSMCNEQAKKLEELNNTYQVAEIDLLKAERASASATSERDMVAARLVKRSREKTETRKSLETLIHENKLTREKISKADAERNDLVQNLEILKLQIPGLKEQLVAIKNEKILIHSLNRQVSKETKKLEALKAMSSRPLNIHKWRFLVASDPDLLIMMKKVRELQKQVIDEHGGLKRIEDDITEKREELKMFKATIWDSPAQLQEQLNELRQTVKENEVKVKQAESEAASQRHLVQDLQCEKDRLQRELSSLMQHYFNFRRGQFV